MWVGLVDQKVAGMRVEFINFLTFIGAAWRTIIFDRLNTCICHEKIDTKFMKLKLPTGKDAYYFSNGRTGDNNDTFSCGLVG